MSHPNNKGMEDARGRWGMRQVRDAEKEKRGWKEEVAGRERPRSEEAKTWKAGLGVAQ